MKAFQRRRIIDARFALNTLQNPNLDVTPRPAPMPTQPVPIQLGPVPSEEPANQSADQPANQPPPAVPASAPATAPPANTVRTATPPPDAARTNATAPAAPPSRTPEEIQAGLDLASTPPLLKKLAERESLIAAIDPQPYRRDTAEQEIARQPEKKVESSAQQKSAKTSVKVRRTFKKKRVPRRLSTLARQKRSASSLAPRPPRREPTDLERHARKCLVCKHPDREEIEHEFLSWHHPGEIADDFDLPESRYVYRHARATGLLDLRRMNVRSALEHLIEESNRVQPQAETVVRAIRAYTRINARGEWNEPPSHVIYSTHHENVHQSVHQDIANQLNVGVQSASVPMSPSAPVPLPPPIDLQLLPPAGVSPETSAGSSAAQPDSNHGSVIRNHT